jgi:hypothetical protein
MLFYFSLELLAYASSYLMDLGGMEFSFLYQVQFIEKYKNIYAASDQYPFFIFFYPPLYPYMQFVLLKFFKANLFTDIHKALMVGRFLSLFLLFIDAFLITRMIRLLTKVQSKKLYILLLFIVMMPAHFLTFRPDSIKVTFFILFLLSVLHYHFISPRKRDLMLAITFGLIATFFKHDVAIYIVSYFACHFIFYKRKESVYTGTAFLLLVAAGFIFCALLFGPSFFKNLFNYNIQYSWDVTINLILLLTNIFKTLPFLIITYLNSRSSDQKTRFIALLGLVFAVISNITLLRAGSNLNYTYESLILLIVNFGAYLHQKPSTYNLSFVALLFYLLLFNKHLSDATILEHSKKIEEKALYENNIKTSRAIQEVIGSDVTFFSNGKYTIFNASSNLIYGYDLHLERFTELYINYPIRSKIFSNPSVAKYDSLFTSGYVKYVIIENNLLAKEQIKKFYKNYYFYKQIDKLQLYRTK